MLFTVISLSVLCMILQSVFIAVERKEKFVASTILKGLASVCFCVIGCLAFSKVTPEVASYGFVKLIFAGLILGLAGDVLLALRYVFEKIGQKIFLAGIAAFLAGHILYLIALIPLSENLLVCVIIGLVIAAVILTIIFKTFEVKIAFKVFGIVYICAVVVMTSIAIGNCIASNFATAPLVYAIGALLFMASDVVMIFNTFGTTTHFSLRITNLTLYYIGQLLIAASLFLI